MKYIVSGADIIFLAPPGGEVAYGKCALAINENQSPKWQGVPTSQESTMAASATASAAVTGVADNFSTGRRPVLHQHHQCQALFILTAKFLRRSCFGAGVHCHDCGEEITRPPRAVLGRGG
mmetsp:Transcript_23090/g.50121  ORF Transcript_23090/g.50121 Transcript_23090/m.50121 type:complete len:121 (-) Transcript_23090:281-643(-)